MIELELELIRENPHWLSVLLAYRQAHDEQMEAVAKTATPEPEEAGDGALEEFLEESDSGQQNRRRPAIWLARITSLDGFEAEELSKAHGSLIAYGLLKCDLADRSAGVVYQLTSTAKQVMNRLTDDHRESIAA